MNIYRKGTKTTRDLDEFLKSVTGGALQVNLEKTKQVGNRYQLQMCLDTATGTHLIYAGRRYGDIAKRIKRDFITVQKLKTLGIAELIKEKSNDN